MEIIYKKVEDLIPYEKNPRKNDDAVEYVANSIREFGFKVPIVIDQNNVIVAGHTRLKASKILGLEEVPCVVADDLTQEQIKAYRLADNKTGEFSSWDDILLSEELSGIYDIDMSDFGFFDDLSLVDEIADDKYTVAVNIPQYEITGEKPTIEEMMDDEKSRKLIAEIEASSVSDEEKHFLIEASKRHIVFNYRNIAEYYAHADEEMQRLMEKSALVIIDVDNAIANGYATLMADILDLMEDDNA